MTDAARRMSRNAALLAVALGGLAWGLLKRPVDPLDWKISGSSLDHLQAPITEAHAALPPDLAPALVLAINQLRESTPGQSKYEPDSRLHPLYLRLNGLTVREVIIAGLERHAEVLLAQVSNDSAARLRLVERSGVGDDLLPAQQHAMQDQLDHLQARIADGQRAYDESVKRLAALRRSDR